MNDPLRNIGTRATPQTERPIDRPEMVPNSGGGYAFVLDDWARLRRFLVLGTEGGTYYTGERELTLDNAEVVVKLAATDGERLVAELVAFSEAGRAKKVNPTLFALACAAASPDLATRAAAYGAIRRVCRTATHLFTFVGYVKNQRGWSRGLRSAVAGWYLEPDVEQVAYQAIKYRQRAGFTHRDLLRFSHAKTTEEERRALFDWMCGRCDGEAPLPAYVHGFELIQREGVGAAEAVRLISEYGLPWEAVPSDLLTEAAVWEALLDSGMGITALIRNLGRLTAVGAIRPMALRTHSIANRISNRQELHKGRVHPVQVLDALLTYKQGHGARGSLSWDPVAMIVDALDAGFYEAFAGLEPSGKRTMLALDVSGSMTYEPCGGSAVLRPREASAAMAMVTAAKEPAYMVMAFSSTFMPLSISPRQRLDDVVRTISDLPFAGTDCALPMTYARKAKLDIDTFVVYTDNETNARSMHPYQALREYRSASGIAAKLIVVGMTATGFSIADPSDPGMLDVVGFDSAAPGLIADFSRGDI